MSSKRPLVYKLVFQVPYDAEWWDPAIATSLRRVTPGDPHGPHVKIYPDQIDRETGAPCAFIRCKHHSLAGLQRLVGMVMLQLEELVPEAED